MFEFIKLFHYRHIRPIKNFFFWGKAFSNSYDRDTYGDLYKFIMLKTEKFLKVTKTTDSLYVGSERCIKTAKILHETSSRLFNDEWYDKETPYSKEMKKLEKIWFANQGKKEKDDGLDMFAFHTVEESDEVTTLSPVKGGLSDRYFVLKRLQVEWYINIHKSTRELFFKHIKKFDELDW